MSPTLPTLRWVGGLDGHLVLIDQTQLPWQLVEIQCHHVEAVVEAIRCLRVRGAPAIGIAAAYGICLGLQSALGQREAAFFRRLEDVTALLAASRPTAVNLFWALERQNRRANQMRGRATAAAIAAALLAEAHAIHEEDRQTCRAIGHHGAQLLADHQGVLTHCNAGGLATAGYGTALAVLFTAHEQGKKLHVYVDETRPLLQGSRLTAWELAQQGMDVTIICDAAAARVIGEKRVQTVITGADRIAANGDTANKIGTYSLALAAAAHGIPFYVAAPTSTFDLAIASGEEIPIELRSPEEIIRPFGTPTAPHGVRAYNPAFDVTPARLITAIICEQGVIQPVTADAIAAVARCQPLERKGAWTANS
jgi:methylthioribose-1-phosphate isomerase